MGANHVRKAGSGCVPDACSILDSTEVLTIVTHLSYRIHIDYGKALREITCVVEELVN
jgi:hypothetical protein